MALAPGVEGAAQASKMANREGMLDALSSLPTTYKW